MSKTLFVCGNGKTINHDSKLAKEESYVVLPNKIVYVPRTGDIKSQIEKTLLLARKYKLPVVLKFTKKKMIITPGDGYMVNNLYYIWRLVSVAMYCEYGIEQKTRGM